MAVLDTAIHALTFKSQDPAQPVDKVQIPFLYQRLNGKMSHV